MDRQNAVFGPGWVWSMLGMILVVGSPKGCTVTSGCSRASSPSSTSGTLAEAGYQVRRRTVVDHDDAMRMLQAIAAAFDEHDLDGIMSHFTADAVFEGPRGPDPWGQRFVGLEAIRAAFAARFSGIPDVRYQHDKHFVDGDRGASEWTLSGTTTAGERIEVRGCDLWTFRDDMVVLKDSYWKIRTTS